MNIQSLQPFIKESAKSTNIKVKLAAESLLDEVITGQQDEEIPQPELHSPGHDSPLNDKPKDELDVKLDKWMPDLAKPETNDSLFGKTAASFTADVPISSLNKTTQADILKFIPSASKSNKVIQYGMVVEELLPKIDKHNFDNAQEHVKAEETKTGRRTVADKFQSKLPDKYILLINDKIIDGHHFLAMAKLLNISNSLKVLDLTPVRFQLNKKASLFDRLRQ